MSQYNARKVRAAINGKALIPLVAGLGIAGLAGKLGLDYIQKAKASVKTETVTLWAVAEPLDRNVLVDEQMLRPMEFPVKLAPRDALHKKEDIIGRVPEYTIPAGLPLLDSMLLAKGERAGLYVPPGLRAVGVSIDESSGVSNLLQPGCYVDVVAYFDQRVGRENVTVSRTIVEDVEVGAVGRRLTPEGEKQDPDAKGKSSKEKPARSVTLFVKPEQVKIIHLAEQRGKLKLALRNREDGVAGKTDSPVDFESLLNGKPGAVNDEPGLLGQLMDKFISRAEPVDPADMEPGIKEVETTPIPTPTAEPTPVWVMRVFNGPEETLLSWDNMKSFQPKVLGAKAPNIFEDEQKRDTPPADDTVTPAEGGLFDDPPASENQPEQGQG
ncbi:MAG: Flp pilus assembly protein CpaB [Phycisphaerales bacterium]|nr:Flp pilus assembly protein CpaB [Phycisphaerales bacterium]